MGFKELTKKVFIIAELSANHNNDYDLAVRTIEEMSKSGADAVKVQTYTADSLTLDVDNQFFGPRKEGLWAGKRPYDVFTEGAMPYEWQPRLKKIANELGMEFFSSPFDIEGVDFLETMQVSLYKVASFEITDIPLIKYVASKGKPVILSTGVAELADIERAVNACLSVGNREIALLKCTSEYPAPIASANLLTIPNLRDTFNVTVGVSDHTMGTVVPTVSVALGARIIEKHFILDRSIGGPDASFSMEPSEFKEMVENVRNAESSLGSISYRVSDHSKLRRRSLFFIKDIKKGEVITSEHIKAIRPGNGASPHRLDEFIGKVSDRDFFRGDPVR